MNYLSILYLITLVVGVVLCVFMMSKPRKLKRDWLLIGSIVILAYWAFIQYMIVLADSAKEAVFWQTLNFPWSFGVVFLFHFIVEFFGNDTLLKKKISVIVLYLSALVIALTALFIDYPKAAYQTWWGWSFVSRNIIAESLVRLYGGVFSIGSFLLSIFYYFRIKNRERKKQAGYVIIGVGFPLVIGTLSDVVIPLWIWPEFPSLATVSFGLGMIFLWYAVLKSSVMTIKREDVADEIIDGMEDVLIVIDENDKILRINNAASLIWGGKSRKLEGKSLGDVVKGLKKIKGGCKDIHDSEIKVRGEDGKDLVMSVSCSFIKGKDKKKGRILVFHDITHDKRNSLLLKEKNRELDKSKRKIKANLNRVELLKDRILKKELDMVRLKNRLRGDDREK